MSFSHRLFFFCAVFSLFVFPSHAFALDLGSIVSDQEFTDASSMSLSFIGRFLQGKSGRLGNYSTTGYESRIQSAAEIIFSAATKYTISPKVVIVTLQKESSAITKLLSDDQLEGYVMGFGVCDSCSKDDPKVQKYKGFQKQIDSATSQFRNYLDNPSRFRHQVGQTHTIDNESVLVKNKASAALLNYTPHSHGNELFRDIWNRWFLQKYGEGALLKAQGGNAIYIVQDEKARPFLSQATFLANYSFADVITVSQSEIDSYDKGENIKYPEGVLLQDKTTGGIYLHTQNVKRPIASREVFRNLGFNPEEIVKASPDDLSSIPTGEKVTQAENYPQGALLRSKATGGILYVKDGVGHALYSKEILKNQFKKNKRSITVDQAEIESFENGDPIKFRDGTLITSPKYKAIYLILNGSRHPFPSKKVFDDLGYRMKNLIKTSDRAVEIHAEGEPVGDF